jgi:hypothetical protein
MNDLVKKLWKLSKENPKGFTVTIPELKPVTSGWCIGHKETQNSFNLKGLRKVVAHSMNTTKVVGGWKGYDGKYYFDTVIITRDVREANDLKFTHKQLAIYEIETGRVI